METATTAASPVSFPFAAAASDPASPPWDTGKAVAIAAPRPAARPGQRRAAPRSPIVDRGVGALTLLIAASLFLGNHGAHAPAPRELAPIVIITSAR